MKTETAKMRSSRRTLGAVVAALLLALLASAVPIAESQASALPQVTEAEIKHQQQPTPSICFLLLLDLGGKHGKLNTLHPEIGLDIPDQEVPDADDESKIDPDEPHPSDGVVDAYRDLNCADLPGFPDL